MIKDTVKVKIRDHDYEIGYLSAHYNYKLWLRFTSYIGCSFAEFFNGNATGVGEGFNKIVNSLYVNDPNGTIIYEILAQTKRDGVPISNQTFDNFYTGNIGEMLEALLQSIKVHFAPFFYELNLSGLLGGEDQSKANSAAS